MPIVVAHSPSAEALGGAAFVGGQGQRAERDLDRARQDQARREQLIVQQVEAEKNRQLRLKEQEGMLSYYNQREQRYANQQEQEQAFRQQVYEEAPARALQEALNQQEVLKDRFKWEYSQSDQRNLAKVQDAIGWVRQQVADGAWRPEEAEIAERQLWQKYHAITPSLAYDDSPTPNEIFNKSRVIHPNTGEEYFIDARGKFYKPQDQEKELATKMTIEAATLAGKLMLLTKVDTVTREPKPIYTPEQAIAYSKQIYGIKSEGGQTTGQEGAGTATQPQVKTEDDLPPETVNHADELFDDKLTSLEKVTTGRATIEQMTKAGKSYVASLVKEGVPEDIASQMWLTRWQEKWKKEGVLIGRGVAPNPKDFDVNSIKAEKAPEPAKNVWVKSIGKDGVTKWTLTEVPNSGTPGNIPDNRLSPYWNKLSEKQKQDIADALKSNPSLVDIIIERLKNAVSE